MLIKKEQPSLAQLYTSTAASNQKLSCLDVTRFRLPVPSDSVDPADWQSALENAQAQLEHQENRLMNLELVGKFGSNSWKLANYQLEGILARLKLELDGLRGQILEINRNRRESQVSRITFLHSAVGNCRCTQIHGSQMDRIGSTDRQGGSCKC